MEEKEYRITKIKSKLKIKKEMANQTETIKSDLKNLFYAAWAKQLEEVNKAEKVYEDITKNPKNATADKLLEAVYNRQLAYAKMDALEEALIAEGGTSFPHKGK